MKRTQSKAVKPARKGAVKVPKGWVIVPVGNRRPRDYKWYCPSDLPGTAQGWHTGQNHGTEICRTDCLVIRRNPRAVRAHKGRKV